MEMGIWQRLGSVTACHGSVLHGSFVSAASSNVLADTFRIYRPFSQEYSEAGQKLLVLPVSPSGRSQLVMSDFVAPILTARQDRAAPHNVLEDLCHQYQGLAVNPKP